MNNEAHPTPKKIETVKELTELLDQAKGLYLADFTGLNVEQANKLRRSFRGQNAVYRVFKNTLIQQAFRQAGYNDLLPYLEGPTALAISFDDPVVPVRLISDFVKEMEKQTPVIKAGILEKIYISAKEIESIKNIPPRDILLAQILAAIEGPISNFVMVLNETLRSFVGVLQALIEKRQASCEDQTVETKAEAAVEVSAEEKPATTSDDNKVDDASDEEKPQEG